MRLKRWFRSLEPRVLQLLDGPLLRRIRPWLDRQDVLSFQRNPLALGVAIGMFCGLIPGPLQVPSTLLCCALWRGNVVAGVVVTAYTNPLTIVPLYVLAFQVGQWLLPGSFPLPPVETVTSQVFGSAAWMQAMLAWVQAMGWPLVIGLPVMGLVFAALSYALVQLLWLAPVLQRLRQRRRRVQAAALRR